MDNRKLNRVFDQIKPSPAREEAMLARLLREEEREELPTMKRRKKLTAVMALAAALVLTVCAFAVAAALEPELLRHFGASSEDEQLLCAAAVPLDQTIRGGGGTFRLRQAVADRYRVKILMDFTAPEGTVLDGDFYKPESFWDIYGADGRKINTSWGSNWELVEDGDPTDNRITLIFTLHLGVNSGQGSVSLLGGTLRFRFENLYRDNFREDLVLEGKWSGSIALPEEDPGAWYPVDQPTDIGGHSVKLSALYVSPISLTCDLEEGAESLQSIQDTAWEDWQEGVALVTASGERVGVRENDYSMHISYYSVDRDGEAAHFYWCPDRIIDPAEIGAVELFGQTIELDPAILDSLGAAPEDAPLLTRGILSGGGITPEILLESEGGTLRLLQAWSDRYRLEILWELTAPEGMVLDGDAYRLDGEHSPGWRVTDEDGKSSTWNGTSAWSGGWVLVEDEEDEEDEDAADNRIILLQTIQAKGGAPEMIGGSYTFHFTQLRAGNIGEEETVLAGDWSDTVPLPEEDLGLRYDIGQTLTLDGKPVLLESIYISPITLVLELGEGSLGLRREDYRAASTDWREHLFLITEVGERVAMDKLLGGWSPDLSANPEGGRCVCRPEDVVIPARIAAVELFGQTIQLNRE